MNFWRQHLAILLGLCALCALCAMFVPLTFAVDRPAPPATPAKPVSAPALPSEFAGWQLKGTIAKSDDPSVADPTDAPVLKEYGFQRLEKASYARDDGRNLTIKAAVFADASGAYGAFTYYQSPEMADETIGGQAASSNNRVLFYQGNVLVDAVFDRVSVMSAAQLRQLAGLLPQAEDSKRNPPSLPMYLPKGTSDRHPERNTTKYVLGPVGLDRVGSPLPASMVDFSAGAEVVMTRYEAKAGDSTLMLIEYPTPQIAAE